MTRLSPRDYALPSQILSLPDFFYTNAVYDRAYKSISSALRTRKGLILLVGEAGTGKTKLMRLMSRTIEEQIRIYTYSPPPANFTEVLAAFDDIFVMMQRESTLSRKLEVLTDHLDMWVCRGGTTALVIDDAHTLDIAVLGQLALLLDINNIGIPLLQIVLVGRPELETKLATLELSSLHERVTVRASLTPLPTSEVRTFIHQRYRSPRGLRQYLFTLEAIERVAHYSGAIPARINLLCDSALMAAYVQGQKVVVPEVVDKLAEKLFLAPDSQPSPPVPHPELLIPREQDQFTTSSIHAPGIHHIRHHLVRSGRALITIGSCAMVVLAGITMGKQLRLERLTAAVPHIVKRGKQAFSALLPQSLMADPVVIQSNPEPQPVRKKPQKRAEFKP